MKETDKFTGDGRSVIYFFALLVLVGAFVPLLYLMPVGVVLTGYVFVCAFVCIAEILIDHLPHRTGRPKS